MKIKLSITCFLLFISCSSFAQITTHGFSGMKWKSSKSSFHNLKNCTSLQAGENFENCECVLPDSLFLGKYKYSYGNFRFFKGKFCEANFDLDHKDVADLISLITIQHGKPVVKEPLTQPEDTRGQVIGYEWIIGDTKVLIVNKGKKVKAWCTLSSISMKKLYQTQKEVDIENLIFE